MNVELIRICKNPTISIAEVTKQLYPDIKLSTLHPSDIKRLFKKLIRKRDILLKTSYILLKIKCPLFVYYELKSLSDNLKLPKFDIDPENIEFDIDDEFTEKYTSQLICLHKKVKSILKKINGSLSSEKIMYFLPMSIMVSFPIVFDFLELFHFLTISDRYDCLKKTKELIISIYESVNKICPEIFTTSNIELYLGSKE